MISEAVKGIFCGINNLLKDLITPSTTNNDNGGITSSPNIPGGLPIFRLSSKLPFKSLIGTSISWLKKNKSRGWQTVSTGNNEGWIWVDENNVERLRFMRPNGNNPANSLWSRQAIGYFR